MWIIKKLNIPINFLPPNLHINPQDHHVIPVNINMNLHGIQPNVNPADPPNNNRINQLDHHNIHPNVNPADHANPPNNPILQEPRQRKSNRVSDP